MTVFSKKAFAFPNPDGEKEFRLEAQGFAHNLPDKLRNDEYFKMCVADGDIVVMDSAKQLDDVLKNGTSGKRNKAVDEQPAEALGIIDGGDSK